MTTMTGDQLDAMVFPPMNWCVGGVIPEGTGLLVSPPKVGKSFFVAGVGLACAYGGIALGAFQVEPRPVLYLALEDGWRRLQSRFRVILPKDEPIPAGITLEIDASGAVRAIEDFFHDHPDDHPLVILDTFGKVMNQKPGQGSQYVHDYKEMTKLMDLQRQSPGSTLLIVHHTRKDDSTDFVDQVSGTAGIAGAADFVMVLERERGKAEGRLRLTGRDVTEEDYAVKFQDCLWTIDNSDGKRATGHAEKQSLSETSTNAIAFILSRPETTTVELAQHLSIAAKRASEIANRLANRGIIVVTHKGVYSPPSPAVSSMADATRPPVEPRPEPGGEGLESEAPALMGVCADSAGDAGQGTILNPHSEDSADKRNPHTNLGVDTHADCETPPDQGYPHYPHYPQGVPGRECKTPECSNLAYFKAKCQECLALDAVQSMIARING